MIFFSHKNEVTGFMGYEVIERNHNEGIKPISERQVSHFPLALCRKFKPVCAFDVEEEAKLSRGTKETRRRWEGREGQEKQGHRSVGGRRPTRLVYLFETSKKLWLGKWMSKWE